MAGKKPPGKHRRNNSQVEISTYLWYQEKRRRETARDSKSQSTEAEELRYGRNRGAHREGAVQPHPRQVLRKTEEGRTAISFTHGHHRTRLTKRFWQSRLPAHAQSGCMRLQPFIVARHRLPWPNDPFRFMKRWVYPGRTAVSTQHQPY